MKIVQVVCHDEYCGTIQRWTQAVPEEADATEIWKLVTHWTPESGTNPEPGRSGDGWLEDWDACGPHHNGMITRAWWGQNAENLAGQCYKKATDAGAEPTEG